MPQGRRIELFCCWLTIGVFLYLADCEIASVLGAPRQDVPWLHRGLYAGRALFFTLAWIVFPVFKALRDRISSQPRE